MYEWCGDSKSKLSGRRENIMQHLQSGQFARRCKTWHRFGTTMKQNNVYWIWSIFEIPRYLQTKQRQERSFPDFLTPLNPLEKFLLKLKASRSNNSCFNWTWKESVLLYNSVFWGYRVLRFACCRVVGNVKREQFDTIFDLFTHCFTKMCVVFRV